MNSANVVALGRTARSKFNSETTTQTGNVANNTKKTMSARVGRHFKILRKPVIAFPQVVRTSTKPVAVYLTNKTPKNRPRTG